MELVPLIKQTLIVVTILFIVALAVSYAASKFKKEKPISKKKLSPKKKIRNNIQVVNNSGNTVKNVKKELGMRSKEPSKPEAKKTSSQSSRRPTQRSTFKPEDRKHKTRKSPEPRIKKRVQVIKDLDYSKNKINKNDSGGIGFN